MKDDIQLVTQAQLDIDAISLEKLGQTEIQSIDNRNTATYSSGTDGYTITYSGKSYTLALNDLP